MNELLIREYLKDMCEIESIRFESKHKIHPEFYFTDLKIHKYCIEVTIKSKNLSEISEKIIGESCNEIHETFKRRIYDPYTNTNN